MCLIFYPSNPIFCDEHLTDKNKRLLMAAKVLKQTSRVKFAWTRNNVKMRESESMCYSVIWIQDESQLNYWFHRRNKYPKGGKRPQNAEEKLHGTCNFK